MKRSTSLLPVLVLSLAACNSTTMTGDRFAPDSGGVDSGMAGTDSGVDLGTPGTDAGTDAGATPTLETLVSGSWSLPPGTEAYKCIRVTLPAAIDIHRFHPVIPMGTHHTVLSIDPTSSTPDGTTDCSGFTNGPFMLFGSGVGTGDLTMPDGIAVHVEAGTQVVLNLHLFNVDATHTLTGTSEIQVERMDPAAVVDRAEIFLAGIDSGLVVPGHTVSTEHGMCTPSAGHVFSVFPHMHQTGVHQTVTVLHHDGTSTPLLDTDYSFDQQQYHDLVPQVDVVGGDRILVDCTYDNPGATKTFGESSTDEMCYAGIYRWPATGAIITCTN